MNAFNVLLVEDNEDLQFLLADCIAQEDPNIRIFRATEGAHALQVLETHSIQLIVSDVMMPKMDGARLTQTLSEDEKLCTVPIFLLTALDEARIAELLKLSNVVGYLRKPVTPLEIATHVIRFKRNGRTAFSGDGDDA